MAQTQTQATQTTQATVISAEHRFFYKNDGAVYHGCSVRQADGTMRRAEQAPQMTVAKIKQFVAMITRKDGTLYNGRPETVYGGPGKRIVANGVVYLVPNRMLEHYQQIADAEQARQAPSDKWVRPDQEQVDAGIDPDALLFGPVAAAAQNATVSSRTQPQARPRQPRSRTAQQTMG